MLPKPHPLSLELPNDSAAVLCFVPLNCWLTLCYPGKSLKKKDPNEEQSGSSYFPKHTAVL